MNNILYYNASLHNVASMLAKKAGLTSTDSYLVLQRTIIPPLGHSSAKLVTYITLLSIK